jgi:prepilin-type N-terminal cleavage/methylation domain-containing protein
MSLGKILMPTRRAARSGFTLIELMVTLIVLGVVVTLAVAPSMRGAIERHRVEGIHAELLTDLRRARSEAAQHTGTTAGASARVAVTFGSNDDVSCYTLHKDEAGVVCDCTRPPGSACVPTGSPPHEIKSMQFSRAAGVSVSASSPSGPSIIFSPPQGLVTPTDLVIDVRGTTSGRLRTSISGLGVPSVCSPDASIPGVAPC